MNGDKVFNLLGAIVTVALVTTVILPGRQSGTVIRALGDSFSGAIRAAMGQR